ncbi:MAG TPA: hypothetical protein VK403_14310 [Allosphingosinicella sp.]|nr:hypothetical protein [Allosphingosinicella sp.]
MRPLLIAAAALALSAPAAAQHHSARAAAPASVGEVSFTNSGAPAAQAPFLRGLALLHNFEYPSARSAFQEAQKADPGFAMAYWGEAMSQNFAIWMEQDLEAARAALAKLGPSREARLAKAKTPRERAYLDAIETLYGEGTKEARDFAYSSKMAALHAAYPDDIDARAFYALSLLGTAHKGRDYGIYMRAAGLLEDVFPQNRHHPGVLHYLIHSYDDPVHAPLGLRAARLYGKVAPKAGHALHMTSHIFIAMGMWDEVEQANLQAIAVDDAADVAQGKPTFDCGHYSEWLIYARMQKGDPRAERDFAACRATVERELSSGKAPRRGEGWSAGASFAELAVRRLVETGKWDKLVVLPEAHYPASRFTLAYGEVLAARGDVARLRAARATLLAAHKALAASRGKGGEGGEEHVLMLGREKAILAQAEALEKLETGDTDGGIAALAAAAEAEAALPVAFGPPLVEKPSRELLAEALAKAGRKADAAAAYEKALLAAPGRRLLVEGLAAVRR